MTIGVAEVAKEDHKYSTGSHSSEGKAAVCPGRESGAEKKSS